MRRRKFITLLGGAAAWPLAALAQQAGRTYRLGCLLPSLPNEYVAFFDELRRRSFIEGQNLTVEYRRYKIIPTGSMVRAYVWPFAICRPGRDGCHATRPA